jgi:predicted nuclease with TOPRIM domain
LETEFLVELEKKVNSLIESYTKIKEEKKTLETEITSKNSRIQEIEGDNDTLRKEMQTLKDISADQKKKLDTASEKVKGLIARLEAVGP